MNLFEDKAFATASIKSIVGHYGKLVYDKKDLPSFAKEVRISPLGYTLPLGGTQILPLEIGDIYIGRQYMDTDLKLNDFVVFTPVNNDGHYLYITSDMLNEYHRDILSTYYGFVNNHKNYHAMWFRSAIEDYKLKNPRWSDDLERTFADLKPVFDSHYALATNLRINRFISEMSILEDFYSWTGFLNLKDKTRYL